MDPVERDVEVSAVIKCAEKVIALIRILVAEAGIKPVGTTDEPVTSKSELVILCEEHAMHFARVFWEDNFSKWAK